MNALSIRAAPAHAGARRQSLACAHRPPAVKRDNAPGARSVAAKAFQTSSNPALKYADFSRVRESGDSWGTERRQGEVMTMDGAMAKTAILLMVTAVSGGYAWQQLGSALMAAKGAAAIVAVKSTLTQYSMISGIGGLGIAFATMFKPNWSPVTAPMYAACKGAFLGALSLTLELSFPGIVMKTVLLTLGTAFGLLFGYRLGFITVSDRFRSIIGTMIAGVCIAYLGTFLLSLVGLNISLFTAGPLGLGISCVTTFVAASSLLLDYDAVRTMEFNALPKYMEWYGGFTILVSLVWLYTELLRLLSMFGSRSD